MPKLVSAGANWTPKGPEGNKLPRLYEAWEAVLPADCLQQLLHTLVLPKLKAEVEGWNPRVDPVPIHAWMHPWLPLAANELEELYPVIRYSSKDTSSKDTSSKDTSSKDTSSKDTAANELEELYPVIRYGLGFRV